MRTLDGGTARLVAFPLSGLKITAEFVSDAKRHELFSKRNE